jgi:hypothetical protein
MPAMMTKTYILLILLMGVSISLNTHSQERKKIPIPGLYNTGVDNNRTILGDGETDPHYVLSLSSDDRYPGPDTKVVFSDIFPIGTWIENDIKSKWIAPRSDAGEFNNFGTYVYTLYFSLNGFKPETAEIVGFWTTDNNGADILVNGNSTGYATVYNAFAVGFFPFSFKEGFTYGTNSISFVVNNGEAPTGLRVVIYGEAEPIDAAMNDPQN